MRFDGTLEDDQAELENYPLWNWHRYAITVGKLFTHVPLSPNSIILVLVKGCCGGSIAIATGLAESNMAAYLRVCD